MSPSDHVGFARRLSLVRERIAAAARRAGRDPGEVLLVAVSKRHPPEAVAAAIAAGVRDFGENYVQEAQEKVAALGRRAADGEEIRWHLIGALQANKARAAVRTFDLVQSVDRDDLARRLGRIAAEEGRTLPVLVEVNLTPDPSRAGAAPEEAPALCERVAQTPGLELRGLMGMAPFAGDPRPHFARLREMFGALPDRNRRILSMGMSGDFEVAVEEGATLVRVGTALFGPRG